MDRLAIERRARPHVMGDVGDGDGADEAAGVLRVLVRGGVNRVVVVLGVGRIDGDQRQVAPILALAQGHWLAAPPPRAGPRSGRRGGCCGRASAISETARSRRHRADDRAHLGPRRPETAARMQEIDRDEIAVLGVLQIGRGDDQLAALLVDRHDPRAARLQPDDAERRRRLLVEHADDARRARDALRQIVRDFGLAQQHAIADAGRRGASRPAPGLRLGEHQHQRRRPVRLLVPFVGHGEQLAVGIAPGHVGDEDLGERPLRRELLVALLDDALDLEFLENPLQRDLGTAGDAEGARDFALAGRSRVLRQEGEHLLARGQRVAEAGPRRRRGRGGGVGSRVCGPIASSGSWVGPRR